MDRAKPPFQSFIKDIPEDTLEKPLGYVDPEKTTQLLLDPELEKTFISEIQQNALCSPGTLGENLRLSPKQIDEAIHASSWDAGLQIHNILCKWVEANQSRATVRALMEGLWNSDDIQTLKQIQGMFVASEATHDRKAKADVHPVADNALQLPTGSRYIPSTLVQQAESPGYHRHPVVTVTAGVLAKHSCHTGSAFDRTDSTEEPIPKAPYGAPMIPYFLLHKTPDTPDTPEERPLELALQQPSQASIPPRKTECIAPFASTIHPKTLTPPEAFPNLVQGGAVQETSLDSLPQKLGEMVVSQQTSDSLNSQGPSLSNGNTTEQDNCKSSNHEKRIQQLEEGLSAKDQTTQSLQRDMTEMKDNFRKYSLKTTEDLTKLKEENADLKSKFDLKNEEGLGHEETTDGSVEFPTASCDPEPEPPTIPTECYQQVHSFNIKSVESEFQIRDTVEGILMVVNGPENQATLSRMKPIEGESSLLKATVNDVTFIIGMYGVYCVGVIMSSPGNDGPNTAGMKLKKALEVVNPGFVISVGVCFGKDKSKQRLGDIIVATMIRNYTCNRIGDKQTIGRSAHPAVSPRLLNLFQQSAGFCLPRGDGEPVKVKVAPLISGPNLIDNIKEREELFRRFPDAEGGEMEGAGVVSIAQSEGNRPPVIVIKAIVDWGDGKKKKEWQPFGAYAAVSYILYHLDKDTLKSLKP